MEHKAVTANVYHSNGRIEAVVLADHHGIPCTEHVALVWLEEATGVPVKKWERVGTFRIDVTTETITTTKVTARVLP